MNPANWVMIGYLVLLSLAAIVVIVLSLRFHWKKSTRPFQLIQADGRSQPINQQNFEAVNQEVTYPSRTSSPTGS